MEAARTNPSPDDRILCKTSGELAEIYLNASKEQFYCFGECAPLGRIKIEISATAFDQEVEEDEDEDTLTLGSTLNNERVAEMLARMEELSRRWQTIWPVVYRAIIQVREDYGYTAAITRENCKMTITPPDVDDPTWGCELELSPWDGFYVVEFNVDGEILDATAVF